MSHSAKFVIKIILIIVSIGLIVFAFQVGNYLYKIKKGQITPNFSKATSAPKEKMEINLNAKEIIDSKAPAFGSANPQLTIVEFASYPCPHSASEAPIARELMLKYQNKVKFIYREFPIDELYPNSSLFALISKCAQEQGKFWQLHDRIYQLGTNEVLLAARQAGLNEASLSLCAQNQVYVEDIQNDLLDGIKNGVQGTPTFFFIKKGYENQPIKIEGAIPKKTFEEIIDKLLE